mmetsp:Transcript_77037/g.198379  ORF Transcript_77037/g.198379 Transcript_77037/m.198379 type:complete len:208 (+) Transcript_77037:413-1036(+)
MAQNARGRTRAGGRLYGGAPRAPPGHRAHAAAGNRGAVALDEGRADREPGRQGQHVAERGGAERGAEEGQSRRRRRHAGEGVRGAPGADRRPHAGPAGGPLRPRPRRRGHQDPAAGHAARRLPDDRRPLPLQLRPGHGRRGRRARGAARGPGRGLRGRRTAGVRRVGLQRHLSRRQAMSLEAREAQARGLHQGVHHLRGCMMHRGCL